MNLPQQVGPTPLLEAGVVVVGGVEILTNTPLKDSSSTSSTTSLFRPRRRKYRSVGVLKVQTYRCWPVLAPAGFVGMNYRAGPDTVHNPGSAPVGIFGLTW